MLWRHTGVLLICAVACERCPASMPDGNGSDRIDALVDNVMRNEVLYESMDLVIRHKYDTFGREPNETRVAEQDSYETLAKDLRVAYVAQGPLFRVDVDGDKVSERGQLPINVIRMYDGETTRLLDERIGNLIKGRREDGHFIRPHMLLVRSDVGRMHLSRFLLGGRAEGHERVTQTATYEGPVEFNGLNCHKVWLTTWIRGTDEWHSRWELWLAEDRNYLPVRMLAYTRGWSPDIPKSEGTVENLREVQPGVWFPVRASRVSYEPLVIRREGRQEPRWRELYHVEKVSLTPQYDISFFRDLEFPRGTAMYEVENGEIKRSWRQGAPEAPGGPTASVGSRWSWLLWANGAALVVLAAVVLVWKALAAKAASKHQQ